MKKSLLRLRPKRTGNSAGSPEEETNSAPESPRDGALESPKSNSDNSNPINDTKLKLDELSLKGKIILKITFQYLYFVLDDTANLPVPTIQEFRALKEHYKEFVKTRKGRLLLALISTPSFLALFQDEHEVDESKVHKSAKNLADEALIKRTLALRHTQVRTNIFLDSSHKPCIPDGLLQTTPGCTRITDHFFYNDLRGSHIESGIHSPFRTDESVVNNFVKISALLIEIAKAILACNEVGHLAQENDEIFTSTDSAEQILLLLESFKQLCTETDLCRTALSTILAARIRGIKEKKVIEIPKDTPWKKNMAHIFSGELNRHKLLSTTSSECIAIIETAKSLLISVETKTPRKKMVEDARQKFVKATAHLNEHITQFLHPRPPAPSFSPPVPQNTDKAQTASLSKSNGAESPRAPEELDQVLASKEKKALFGKLRSLSEKRLAQKPLTSDKDLEKDTAKSPAVAHAETDAKKTQDDQTTAEKQDTFAKGRSVSVKNMGKLPFHKEGESITKGITKHCSITLGRGRTGSVTSPRSDADSASPSTSSPRDDAVNAAPKVDQRSIKTGDMKKLWASRESSGGSKDSPFLTRKSGTTSPRSTVTTNSAGKMGTPETSPRTVSNTPQSPTSAKKESPRSIGSGTISNLLGRRARSPEPPKEKIEGVPFPSAYTTTAEQPAVQAQSQRRQSQTFDVRQSLKVESPVSSPEAEKKLAKTSATSSTKDGLSTQHESLTREESPRSATLSTSPSLSRPKPPASAAPTLPTQQEKSLASPKKDEKVSTAASTSEQQPPEQQKEPPKTAQSSTSPRAENLDDKKQEKPADKRPTTTVVVTPVAAKVGADSGKSSDPNMSSSKTAEELKQPAHPAKIDPPKTTDAAPTTATSPRSASTLSASASKVVAEPKRTAPSATIDPPKQPDAFSTAATSPRSTNADSVDNGGVDKNSIKPSAMKKLWAERTGGSSPQLSRKSETTESGVTYAQPQTQEPPPQKTTKPAEEPKTRPEIVVKDPALPISEKGMPPVQQPQPKVAPNETREASVTSITEPSKKEAPLFNERAIDDSQLPEEKTGTSEQLTVDAASLPPPSDKEGTGELSKEPTSPRNSTASSGRPRAGTGPDKFNAVRKPPVPKPITPGARPDPALLQRLSAAKKATPSDSPPTSPRGKELGTPHTDEVLSAIPPATSNTTSATQASSSPREQKESDKRLSDKGTASPDPNHRKDAETSSLHQSDDKDQGRNSVPPSEKTDRLATSLAGEVPTVPQSTLSPTVATQPISKNQLSSQENFIPKERLPLGSGSQSPSTTTKQSIGAGQVVTEREKQELRENFLGGGPRAFRTVVQKTTFTAIGPNVSKRRPNQAQEAQSLEEVIKEAEQILDADRTEVAKTMPSTEQKPTKTHIEFFRKSRGTPDKPGKLHTNENIQEIVMALEENREHEIVLLQNNDIGAFGATQLCAELSQQKKLKILCISNNGKLFHALSEEEMEGRYNKHASVIAFRDFLATHPTLEHLKIDECGLGSFGASILANGLKSNKSLLSLDIRFNDLTNDGIGFICEALMYHPTIESVLISANRLTDKAGEALLELLRGNNHIINLDFFEDADSFDTTREKIENYFSETLTDDLKAAIKSNQENARKLSKK